MTLFGLPEPGLSPDARGPSALERDPKGLTLVVTLAMTKRIVSMYRRTSRARATMAYVTLLTEVAGYGTMTDVSNHGTRSDGGSRESHGLKAMPVSAV